MYSGCTRSGDLGPEPRAIWGCQSESGGARGSARSLKNSRGGRNPGALALQGDCTPPHNSQQSPQLAAHPSEEVGPPDTVALDSLPHGNSRAATEVTCCPHRVWPHEAESGSRHPEEPCSPPSLSSCWQDGRVASPVRTARKVVSGAQPRNPPRHELWDRVSRASSFQLPKSPMHSPPLPSLLRTPRPALGPFSIRAFSVVQGNDN